MFKIEGSGKMDSFKAKRLAEEMYEKGDESLFKLHFGDKEHDLILDLLWDFIAESQSSYEELKELRKRITALKNKSGQRVRCLEVLPDRRALVKLGPIPEELLVSPDINMDDMHPGCEVLVIGSQEGRVVAEVRSPSLTEGRFCKVSRVLDEKRVILEDSGSQLIARLAKGIVCKEGDEVRYESDSLVVLEVISAAEKSTFSLNEKPKTTFDDIKGLEEEKKYLREKIVYPAVYKDKFKKYGLKEIRGALFHGPPGCGKTMLAGAIFNEMAQIKNTETYDGFFIINGPEVLSKWAGNTEEALRKIFQEAREAAKRTGIPSVIFWDEIESITGKRKDTATYTPEKTVVPTLLAELQGVENEGSFILIGATNRPDLIDPALMRPGRLGDAILEIPRPDRVGAQEILQSAFERGDEVPQGLKILLNTNLVERLVAHIYDNEKPLAFANLQSGGKVELMRQEMVNGALFAQIGDELIRKTCMSEIYSTDPPSMSEVIEMLDNILLNQLGVLDAGVKNGFTFNTSDVVIDVSLNG